MRSRAWIAAGNSTAENSILKPDFGLWKATRHGSFHARRVEDPRVKTKLSTALFAFAAFAVLPCFGYSLEGYSWNRNRTVLVHLSLPQSGGSYTDGSATLNASAEDALNTWNQYLVHMQFAVDRNSILPPSGDDGNTSVTMASSVYGESFGSGVLAVTLVTPRDLNLIEADVIFNNAYQFDSYRGRLLAGVQDLHRIALHEFGHIVGLAHPNEANPPQTVVAIMNSTISNVDSLQQDDINGAKSIYDNGPPYLTANPAPSLVNLSTRAFVATPDDKALICGFIIQGSQPATVILRAIGGSLPAIGINNALIDPVMELHGASGGTIATSDDFIDSPDASTIASYHLDPTNSRESAILATLNPGSYTVIVRCWDDTTTATDNLTGTAVVELYDLHTTDGRAGNISTRGQVLAGDRVLIGGFVVGGNQPKTVVVRALGPSLAGVSNALSNPAVELRDASGNLVRYSNNWGDDSQAAQIQSEGLAPSQPAESALQVTLNPGSYTAIVRGVNGATGIGLIEIYDLSPAPN